MDISLAYDQATSEINKVIGEDIMPREMSLVAGKFKFISESSSGHVWGVDNSNILVVCEAPCTGNWVRVPYPEENVTDVYKIATDESNVYLLGATPEGPKLFSKPVNNKVENWNSVVAPETAKDLFVTSNYLWVNMVDNVKQSCVKPCLEGDWKANTDDVARITSASADTLYGVDSKGNAVRTDEGMKTGWSAINGFIGKVINGVVGGDKQLLAFEEGGAVYKCDKDCNTSKEVDRKEKELKTASIAPVKNSSWFLGSSGDTYNQKETSEPWYVKSRISPLVDKRDSLLDRITDFYNDQTNALVSNELLSRWLNALKQMMNTNKVEVSKQETDLKKVGADVKENDIKIKKINEMQTVFQVLIFVLAIVCMMYLIFSWVGSIVNYIAFAIIVAGLIFSIYLRKQ